MKLRQATIRFGMLWFVVVLLVGVPCGNTLAADEQSGFPLLQFRAEGQSGAAWFQVEAGGEFWAVLESASTDSVGQPMPALTDIAGLQGYIAYDPERLKVLEILPGELIPGTGWELAQEQPTAAGIHFRLGRASEAVAGLSGHGELLRVRFQALPEAGGSGIFALQGGSFVGEMEAFSGYLTDAFGQDVSLRSGYPSVLGVSSHVNIIPAQMMITEANVTRQTIAVSFDRETVELLPNPGSLAFSAAFFRKNDQADWTCMYDFFNTGLPNTWTRKGLVIPVDHTTDMDCTFSFSPGDHLAFRLEVYDYTPTSGFAHLLTIETPLFTVPEVLGKPLDLAQWSAMSDFRIAEASFSYRGESLDRYTSDTPPLLSVALAGTDLAICEAHLWDWVGDRDMGHWSFGPDLPLQQELIVDPGWKKGDYAVSLVARWALDPTETTVASKTIPLRIAAVPAGPADINQDGAVGLADLASVAQGYGVSKGDSGFDYRLDLNHDDLVDLFDLVLLAKELPQLDYS